MILVTGGTGLIGSHLLFYLTQKEDRKVRAIYRSEGSLEKIKKIFQKLSHTGEKQFSQIEWVKADINDIPRLETAFRDVSYVFHAAGFISFQPGDFEKLIKINVEGTANIVNLCIDFQVKKLCHVSSVSALSSAVGKITNELSDWNPEDNNHDYAISKHGAEMEVWRGSQEGLKVVVVNPSVVLGAHFWNSGSGLFFKKVADGLSFYPAGGTGFVDVEDVAKAMIALQFSDVENQRFVLNGLNQTYEYILKNIANYLQVKSPQRKISHKTLRLLARLDGFLSFFRIKKRTLTSRSADSLGRMINYDGNKITQFIDFQYKDIDNSLKEICQEYKK
ncbi:NAD-dependent epimerase/dehydratase family protein [Capnocytophaga stomatis]|uniref:NAD-dependent epimerase/dehydratase family protein n=1 Tax=Capnocytophaga stomatis TaxID=1848904 RepID=A0ABW8Q8L5_9FLAO|nr:NAD-dependent epimerase/dehydratase family protein [Capnocytophaga stomatis]GIJ96117.1 NAD-dependent epimerase [Capnocytophaga stomatis]